MVALTEPPVLTPKPGRTKTLPRRVLEHFRRGYRFYQAEDFPRALEEYDAVLTIRPDDPDALCNRAAVLTRLGRHEEALADVNRALALRPDDTAAVGLRREVLDKLLHGLARKRVISWGGGKPKGSHPRIRLSTDRPVSDYVIEDRR